MPENNINNIPSSSDIELRLIAAFVHNPQVFYKQFDIVSSKLFTNQKDLFAKFVNALKTEKVSDFPQLPDIAPSTDPDADIKHLLNLHKEKLTKILLDRASEKLTHEPVDQTLQFISGAIKKIDASTREISIISASSLSTQLPSILEQAKIKQIAAKENGGLVGLPTSLPSLDRLLGGLQPGLHFLSAQPGAGKTTLALQMCRKCAESKFPVVYLTYEQVPSILGLKLICSRYGLNSKPYMDGYGDLSSLEAKINDANRSGWTEKVHIVQGSDKVTVPYLKAIVLAVMEKHNADKGLIVVDYLQRWARQIPSQREFRLVVSALSSELRTLSESLKTPVIAISSQNRGNNKEEPNMNRLRESGDLEYDGDSIIFLNGQPGSQSSEDRQLSLSLLKNRFGNTGDLKLSFRSSTGIMYEISNL